MGKRNNPLLIEPPEAYARLLKIHPTWTFLKPENVTVRNHICIGPPVNERIEGDLPPKKAHLSERVLIELRAYPHRKFSGDEICDKLGASKTSNKVDRALRYLVNRGIIHREGSKTRNVRYWYEK